MEWFLETGARAREERAAREAANPSPLPPPSAYTYDPMAPSRAYLAQRAGEGDMVQRIGADPDGLGSIRRYQATAQGMDAFGQNYAAGARQRNAARAEAARPAPTTEAADTLNVAAPAAKPPETTTAAQPPARVETARQVAAAFGGGAADAVRAAAQGV